MVASGSVLTIKTNDVWLQKNLDPYILTLHWRAGHARVHVFPQECKGPITLKGCLTGEKLQATLWHSKLCRRCTQCADSTPGRMPLRQWWSLTFPFLSSNNMAFRCLWLRIIHWWCPSHEPLRLCIQTLTRLTAQQQTRSAAERAGWMEMSTSGSLWQVG